MRRLFLTLVLLVSFCSTSYASTSYWFASYAAAQGAAATRYGIPNGHQGNLNATEANMMGVLSRAATAKSMTVSVATAPGSGNGWTITLRNGTTLGGTGTIADVSSFNCTITDPATSCSVTSDGALNAKSLISVRVTVAAGTPTASAISWIIKVEGTTSGDTFLMGSGSGTTLSTTATQYLTLAGNIGPAAAETIRRIVVPGGFTVKDFCVYLSTDPGPGLTRTFKGYKNSSSTSQPSVTFDDAATPGMVCDTSTTDTVVAQDLYDIQSLIDVATAAASVVSYGITLTASTPGQFPITSVNGAANLNSGATQYLPFAGIGGITTTADSTVGTIQNTMATGFTLIASYIQLDAVPGAAKSYQIKLRENAADASQPFTMDLTGTVAGPGVTTDSVTGVSFTPNGSQLLDIQIVPAGTPAGSVVNISFLGYVQESSSGRRSMLTMGVGQ